MSKRELQMPIWTNVAEFLNIAFHKNLKELKLRIDTRDLKAVEVHKDYDNQIVFKQENSTNLTDIVEWLCNVYIRGKTNSEDYETSWLWMRNSKFKYTVLVFNFVDNKVTVYNRNNELSNIESLLYQA